VRAVAPETTNSHPRILIYLPPQYGEFDCDIVDAICPLFGFDAELIRNEGGEVFITLWKVGTNA
jgi:hypothetical protein